MSYTAHCFTCYQAVRTEQSEHPDTSPYLQFLVDHARHNVVKVLRAAPSAWESPPKE